MSKPVLLASRQPVMYIRARHPRPTATLKQVSPSPRNSLSSLQCQGPRWNQGICGSSHQCRTRPTEFISPFKFFFIPFYRFSEFTCFPPPSAHLPFILLSHISNTYLPSLPHLSGARAEGCRKKQYLNHILVFGLFRLISRQHKLAALNVLVPRLFFFLSMQPPTSCSLDLYHGEERCRTRLKINQSKFWPAVPCASKT